MVTTLYIVRHGETEGSDVKRYKGSIDVPLSENGIEQIRKASDFISRHVKTTGLSQDRSYLKDIHASTEGAGNTERNLNAVYCSNLSRARRSAEIIARPHGLSPIVMPELRERNFGLWEGMSFSEIKDRYPEEFSAWAANPLKYSPSNGESTVDVSSRAVAALDSIMDRHDGDTIAIVAHGGVNRVMLCHIMGVPLENVFRIEQDFAAVNIIEFWEKYPVVKLLNGGANG